MVFSVGPQALLDAIDGVAYVVDRRGIIRAIGTQAWERFATANGSPELTADRVIGTSLFAGMTGAAVREVCQRLHALVCQRRRAMITYEYRCDAPNTERRMRMSIRSVAGRGGVIMALYQSQLLDETPRLPSGLLSMDPQALEANAGPGADQLVICSFCRDVAWPIGVPEADASWIRIPDYYRRGGSGDVAVSHGICPGCMERMFAADDWAAADLCQGR
jgi:hypothetical protein